MDSGGGVHVWSTPFGYCDDDEVEGCIKDEEEVTADSSGSFLDLPETDAGDLGSDPLSIDTNDYAPSPGGALYRGREVSLAAEEPDEPTETAGPSSVTSVTDELSADSADSLEPELSMTFKAEPESEVREDPDFIVLDPFEVAPVRRAAGRRYRAPDPESDELPVRPDPDLALAVIDAESGRELYRCAVCRLTFRQKMQLQEHYRCEHPGYRPYKCPICGNRYGKQSFLHYHIKLHRGERDFGCAECGKKFVNRTRLNAHLKTARFCPASSQFDVERLSLRRRRQRNLLLNERRLGRLGGTVSPGLAERPPTPPRPRRVIASRPGPGVVELLIEDAPNSPEDCEPSAPDGDEIVELPTEPLLADGGPR